VAGKRQIYEQAMRRGTNYAWDRQWEKAVAEYQRAIAEFPDEAPAYTALGQALVHAGRVEEALGVYQRAARLTPADPLALARVAELQEQLGNVAGAVQTWSHTADLHLRRRAVDPAVQVWQRLVKIAPDIVSAHENLAKAYAGMGQTRRAVRQYLTLAALYQQKGEDKQAAAACQSALELDSRNSDVLTVLDALQHGRSLAELVKEEPAGRLYTAPEARSDQAGGAGSPAEMARQRALEELASALLEDSAGFGGMEPTALLLQGINFQTQGDVEAAIESYEKAMGAGGRHVAAHFNLGLLYQETLRFDEAIGQFQLALDGPNYALGAHFALGECLRALQRLDEALAHFIEVLKQVDLSTVGPESADELQQIYDALAHSYAANQNRDSTVDFINSLVEFLSGEQWEGKLFETRRQLNRLSDGGVISLAEVLALPYPERILASMVRSQECFEQGMLRSATEECLWAIEHAPDYLPLHLHLAKLFMQGNQVENAIGKSLFVADTFAVRGEIDQAIALYEQVLGVAPMDLDVRRKLILLLQEHDMVEQALEHRLALADAYYELAQIESSREQYTESLHLASRLADSKNWTARILHRLADIDMQRLDWRSAIEVYLQLKAAVPGDERARQRLVELYSNLQRQAEAEAELDELIGLYRSQGDLPKALEVLEELTEARPDELELHKRAAQLYVESGHKENAITHLDAMGELLLQAERVQEAVATIKAIIALGPRNADAYRQLLEQIQ
jgi:tetratricopeptide (TPR) repeat protein